MTDALFTASASVFIEKNLLLRGTLNNNIPNAINLALALHQILASAITRSTFSRAHHYILYQLPDTIPSAARRMNKCQSKQDMSLKRLQYLVSGAFRPVDV
ncbi:hypothetical protein BDF21DRAFT_401134 [Thamnidium elegans]|nr:hypothetical protein BDF21DRAFT_401134 [Thamnidium elegans]